ncbi:Tripeptidyl-peptidase 2 [Vitis vinifera]|uniref:Tripeptidyl-peptidase 2 n=1 Tax=Vitis vinifera TaxID=29760 RepID=A0A438HEU7_VITVI|nr:Tripeptidyl-peptidase 2 [Vitis vinifera]
MQNLIWASNPLESPFLGHPCSKLVISVYQEAYQKKKKGRRERWAVVLLKIRRLLRDDNGALRAFKLSESTFLASLIPKKGIAADRFVEGILNSGVLQVTSGGKPKIFDPGSGDIDTSTVVKADSNGCLGGASGASLVVNSSWKNPSGEWHVGL